MKYGGNMHIFCKLRALLCRIEAQVTGHFLSKIPNNPMKQEDCFIKITCSTA